MLVAAVALGGCVAMVASASGSGGPAGATGGSASPAPSPAAGGAVASASTAGDGGPAVPASWESLDQQAAATCPGLSWTVLAAIGRVESDSGQSTLPGVGSGSNPAGAQGPMQFEPATFATYGVVGPGGADPPSPYDPVDAVYTAARLLCSDGAGTDPATAVFDYNHDDGYVDTVLVLAAALGQDPAVGSAPASALAFAAQQLGVPYLWGGTGPGGFDCSGLTQQSYRSAGVTIPRVAQDQYDAGPRVSGLVPGDLVFFGSSASNVSHVGIYVAGQVMIDAPYTGVDVRFDQFPTTPGAAWGGGDDYVGATRPA